MIKDYFKAIDNEEKAYFLGLVSKNDNFITCGLYTDFQILEILSNFCSIQKKLYTIDINDPEIINYIRKATLEFKNFNEEFKIAYLRGLYESTLANNIEITDLIEMILDDIIDFISIRIKIIDFDNSKLITFYDINEKNKFLKIIYNSKSISILNENVKKLVIYNIDNNDNDKKSY
jgi:hypothetical protein